MTLYSLVVDIYDECGKIVELGLGLTWKFVAHLLKQCNVSR